MSKVEMLGWTFMHIFKVFDNIAKLPSPKVIPLCFHQKHMRVLLSSPLQAWSMCSSDRITKIFSFLLFLSVIKFRYFTLLVKLMTHLHFCVYIHSFFWEFIAYFICPHSHGDINVFLLIQKSLYILMTLSIYKMSHIFYFSLIFNVWYISMGRILAFYHINLLVHQKNHVTWRQESRNFCSHSSAYPGLKPKAYASHSISYYFGPYGISDWFLFYIVAKYWKGEILMKGEVDLWDRIREAEERDDKTHLIISYAILPYPRHLIKIWTQIWHLRVWLFIYLVHFSLKRSHGIMPIAYLNLHFVALFWFQLI